MFLGVSRGSIFEYVVYGNKTKWPTLSKKKSIDVDEEMGAGESQEVGGEKRRKCARIDSFFQNY